MADEWENGVVEDVVVAGKGEVHENVEAAGGLKTRSRKNRLLEKGGEIEGDAAVAGEHGRGVYLVREEGVKSVNETNGVGLKEVEQLLTNKSLPNCEADCVTEQAEDFSAKENHYDCEDLKMKNHEIFEEECGRTLAGTEARCENGEQVALPQESELAVEFDLEKILEEQETHDLYCPNCRSRITKRVILRKRKTTAEEIEPIQAVGCLSCLSFFIPTDTGFRLFHCFGKWKGNDNIQSSQQMSGRNQNWLFSLIDLMKGKNKGSKLGGGITSEEEDVENPFKGISGGGITSGGGDVENPFKGISGGGITSGGGDVENPFKGISGGGITSGEEDVENPTKGISGGGITSGEEVPGVKDHGETHIDLDKPMPEPAKTHQWDVLKAIVYGGLLESIASLGVISSAAGSDVTTLNVIALGMANLVSGLLVVIHNLVELKKEQYKSISSTEEADRYREQLGTRGHFSLHATVALLSYILVGTLPLIIYGFSFRKSDSKEYKMIVVAAASLFCIALLAIGKAHVQEGQKTYLETFLYYIGLGIGSSGLSYAIGMLIKKLLEELGLFDDTVVVPSPPLSTIFEVTSRTPSWRSF